MPSQTAFIKICTQRHSSDCAVCCFCMLTGVSYEAALICIGAVDQKLATNGLYFTQIKKAAAQMGFKLRAAKKGTYDFNNSFGILSVKFHDKTEHAVILMRGVIVDPDGGTVWDDVESYKDGMGVKSFGSLLVFA